LQYIGACDPSPESEDVLQFHGDLLMYQIEGLQGISPVHQSFPWRVVQCLDPASWTTVLKDMKEIWQFTTEFADTLRQNDALFNELQVTRFQNFRDTMTKAEQLVLKLRIFSTSFFSLVRMKFCSEKHETV
jgi:hypothetical protein